MKGEDLKRLIRQVKKYGLDKSFDTTSDFDEWVKSLNPKQVKNFNCLTVDPEEILFPKTYLVNKDLLNCDDYLDRVNAMMKIKNAKGWYHIFGRLCSPNFLNSKNYYYDMEMISKAPTAQHPLWIIAEDDFINSPYHKEDFELIINAKDTPKKDGQTRDWLVEEALTEVAGDKDSINGPYHRQDMQLIATSGSDCLQSSNSYPETSLNNLATNSVSLKDPYHLDNMRLLRDYQDYGEYLYELMTNPEIIKGKYYRDEINAIANSKSIITATAMYYFIANPEDSLNYYDYLHDLDLSYSDVCIIRRSNSVKGSSLPEYSKHLKLLNLVDDKFVFFFESLLSNKVFANSPYCAFDLNLLLSIKDFELFSVIYKLMSCERSLKGASHDKDVTLLSQTTNAKQRDWLLSLATDKHSIASPNHDYDMDFLSKIDMESFDSEVRKDIRYYLFNPDGIDHPEHKARLEKLAKGEKLDNNDILGHLDFLENNPDALEDDTVVEVVKKPGVLQRIRKYFGGK